MKNWKLEYKAAIPDGTAAQARFSAWLDGIVSRDVPPGTPPPEYEAEWVDVCGGEPRVHVAFYEAEDAETAKGMLLKDFRMCRVEIVSASQEPAEGEG